MKKLLWMMCFCVLAACSADREPGDLLGPSEEGVLVVDALLIVGRPLPALSLTRTVAPSISLSNANLAEIDAEVEIQQGGQVYRYKNLSVRTGPSTTVNAAYVPVEDPPLVLPQTEYRLRVRVGEEEVTAVTMTPSPIQVDRSVLVDEKTLEVLRDLKTFSDGDEAVYSAVENQVNYLDGLLEVRFSPVDVSAYQVGIFSLDLDSERVIEADFLDEEDYADLEREESSPPLEASDGRLRLPWFAVYFGGRHLIRVYALDKNWFDFVRSSPDENGGGFAGSLAGDSFERPLFHVEGGIGLFGSASVDSVGFFVLPKK